MRTSSRNFYSELVGNGYAKGCCKLSQNCRLVTALQWHSAIRQLAGSVQPWLDTGIMPNLASINPPFVLDASAAQPYFGTNQKM